MSTAGRLPLHWTDLSPAEAMTVDLTKEPYLLTQAPHNEQGERCPWPWDPQQHVGAPLGQYHCPYCGAMVLAGVMHIDYGPPGMQGGPTPGGTA